MDQMAACDHYRHWRKDLELVRSMGLRYLRYGRPLHLIHQGPGKHSWTRSRPRCNGSASRRSWTSATSACLTGFNQNPEMPHALAEYATAFARRYPWGGPR